MTTLRHSAPDWCFFEDRGFDPSTYYRRVKSLGYEAVELVAPPQWSAARDAGLRILAISGGGMREGLNFAANHAKLTPQIEAKIQEARNNAVENVIVFSGNRKGISDSEGLANVIAALKAVLPTAEAAGAGLLFEMLNSFDHEDYQADNAEFGFAVVRALSSPRVKVLYDVYHMYRMGRDEETIVADLTRNIDIIGHIHVAGAPKRDFPGENQQIDYARIIAALHKAGYRGFIGYEFIPSGDPFEELAAAVALFESYVK